MPNLEGGTDLRCAVWALLTAALAASTADAADRAESASVENGLASAQIAYAELALGDFEAGYDPSGHALVESLAGLDRAVAISRRSAGLFNLEQIDALRAMSELYSRSGHLEQAESSLRYIVRIHEQHFGRRDVRTAQAVSALAHWFARAGHYLESRRLYRDSIRMIEQELGKSSTSLVEPLGGFADAFWREMLGRSDFQALVSETSLADASAPRTRNDLLTIGADNHAGMIKLHPSGLRSLERAIGIAESQPEEIAIGKMRSLYVQRGDWQLVSGARTSALASYRRAIELPQAQGSGPTAEGPEFPMALYVPLPRAAARYRELPAESVRESYALLEFSVSASGEVIDPVVIDSTARPSFVRDALKAIRRAVYRPRFDEGSPVGTDGVRYRMVFRQRL